MHRSVRCLLRSSKIFPPSQLSRRRFHFSHDLLDELSSRALLADVTRSEKLSQALKEKSQAVYVGIDPTAQSLHVGHLLPLMCLLHFQLRGHQTIALIGGATGLVGDPSGKVKERIPLAGTKVDSHAAKLKHNVQRFLKSGLAYAEERLSGSPTSAPASQVRNNIEWLGGLGLLEFLTIAGRHARVNTMMARDSVQSRMASLQGISFTEFTYQLLQAYDFYHLHRTANCTIQIGGSDQWGNILAGLDLIQRAAEEGNSPTGCTSLEVFGVTTPLLTTSSGSKFGKSEGNAVWLDPSLTSVFQFYQFFLKTSDEDVGKYLKMLTLLPLEQIEAAVAEHMTSPEKRKAQRLLADELTQLIHGSNSVEQARVATKTLFETDPSKISVCDITSALSGDPRLINCKSLDIVGRPVALLAATHNLAKSNSDARRLVDAKGLYLNNIPTIPGQTLQAENLIHGKLAILRAGKDKHLILHAVVK